MKLSRYTDYALRALIYLAASDGGLVSIRQIAEAHGISQNHLMKIVQDLGSAGFIKTTRGRQGGLQLARPATEITIGQVVRRGGQGGRRRRGGACVRRAVRAVACD